jgi:hypothetical protein
VCPGTASLVANGGFETIGPAQLGQGLLPASWVATVNSADTYSTDGSFGLNPGDFGHFPGTLAFEGIRWVAGADFPESFGQVLATPVQPAVLYRVSAALHRDTGSRVGAGGYEVRLKATMASTSFVVAGTLAAVSSSVWETRSFTFTLPAASSGLPFLELVPVGASSYPAIDDLSLVQVSACP